MSPRLYAPGIDVAAAVGVVASITSFFVYLAPRTWASVSAWHFVLGGGSFVVLWFAYRLIVFVFPRPWLRLALATTLALSGALLAWYHVYAFQERGQPFLPNETADPNLAFVFGPANQIITGLLVGGILFAVALGEHLVSRVRRAAA